MLFQVKQPQRVPWDKGKGISADHNKIKILISSTSLSVLQLALNHSFADLTSWG